MICALQLPECLWYVRLGACRKSKNLFLLNAFGQWTMLGDKRKTIWYLQDNKTSTFICNLWLAVPAGQILLGVHQSHLEQTTASRREARIFKTASVVLFFKAGPSPPPPEAILVIFGRRALIFFFLFESSWKKWKMTPLLCACAVVITLETQKCRKRAPRSVEFNFFNNCDRQKRFSQNERRRADLQNVASDFLFFA